MMHNRRIHNNTLYSVRCLAVPVVMKTGSEAVRLTIWPDESMRKAETSMRLQCFSLLCSPYLPHFQVDRGFSVFRSAGSFGICGTLLHTAVMIL
jgi:hypothetical protein